MKRGLKLLPAVQLVPLYPQSFKNFPDEEGTETVNREHRLRAGLLLQKLPR